MYSVEGRDGHDDGRVDMPSGRDTQLVGRYWPTDRKRPYESVSEWCRRLDDLANRAIGGPVVNPGVEVELS